MLVELSRGHLRWDRTSRSTWQRGVTRLQARIHRYGLEDTKLEAWFSETGPDLLESKLELTLPDLILRSHASEAALPELVQESFHHLFLLFDAWRLRVNHGLRKQVAARGERRTQREETGLIRRHDSWKDFDEQVAKWAHGPLRREAAHQLALLQAQGDVEPGWLDPLDVVEDVLAEILPVLDGNQGLALAVVKLRQGLQAHLEELVREHEVQLRTELSVDDMAPQLSPEKGLAWLETEIGEIWTDDRDLVLEDVLADAHAADPTEVVAEREVRSLLVKALFGLDSTTRAVFEQVVLDGYSPETVAGHEPIEADHVERMVVGASKQLAEALSGELTLEPIQVYRLYAGLGEQLREERAAWMAAHPQHFDSAQGVKGVQPPS